MENKKRSVWRYGLVKLPLEVGSPAWYCRDGFWRKTEAVEKIIETASDHLIFESKHYPCRLLLLRSAWSSAEGSM